MTAAKANLDRFSAKTNASFQADQEDLFGARPSQDNSALFDERADGEAGRELIDQAKSRHDKAKSELSRINTAIRYVNKEKAQKYISVQSTNLIGNGNILKDLETAKSIVNNCENRL